MPDREWNPRQREALERLSTWIVREDGSTVPPAPALSTYDVFTGALEDGRSIEIPAFYRSATEPRGVDEGAVWYRLATHELYMVDHHREWHLLGPSEEHEMSILGPDDDIRTARWYLSGYARRIQRQRIMLRRVMRIFPPDVVARQTSDFRATQEAMFDAADQMRRYIVVVHSRPEAEGRYEILSGPFTTDSEVSREIDSLRRTSCQYRVAVKRILIHEAISTCQHCMKPNMTGFVHQLHCQFSDQANVIPLNLRLDPLPATRPHLL